jgi:hypothetical protein
MDDSTNELRSSAGFKVQSAYTLMTKSDQQIVDEIGTHKSPQLLTDEINLVNSDSQEVHINSKGERTLYQRLFSKMEAGSLRGSIFAMSSLALGTGCLALPVRFSQMSFLGAIIMVLIGSFAAYWSLTIMIEASIKTKSFDYSRLVKQSVGPHLALFLDIVILIYIFGILISYQVISKILYKISSLFIIGKSHL